MLAQNDLRWHSPRESRPFEPLCGGTTPCNPIQELIEHTFIRRAAHGLRATLPPGEVAEHGAEIFGKPKDVDNYVKRHAPCLREDFVMDEPEPPKFSFSIIMFLVVIIFIIFTLASSMLRGREHKQLAVYGIRVDKY